MKGCKLCSTTAIVGCLGLVGLGIAGYATISGKNIFGTKSAAAATADGECPMGSCCPEDKTAEVATVALESEECTEGAKSECCDSADQIVATETGTVIPASTTTETTECTEKSTCTEAKECPAQTAETPVEPTQG